MFIKYKSYICLIGLISVLFLWYNSFPEMKDASTQTDFKSACVSTQTSSNLNDCIIVEYI
jgi:hypothetical protein